MNGYDPSSQVVFSPRQPVFFTTYSMVNGHVFSSRTPALRAASVEPSAVRPDGLWDSRESFSDTTDVVGVTSVDGEHPALRGWQDKAVLRTASPASPQPAPGTDGERCSVSDTGSARSQNSDDWQKRSARMTLRLKPGVKSAMQDLAKDAKMSFSAACAEGLEIYARAKIRDQEEALFEPRMQAMMRREIRSSDNRHVPFEIKNAIASEQTRILIADLYKRQLLKEGIPLKVINAKLDNAYNMARSNVLKTRTPKFKTLVAEWWQAIEDQTDGRQQERPANGEAGTGKPKA
jgi:hypothetical protein